MALAEPNETDFCVEEGGARIYFSRQVAEAYPGASFDWEEDQWGGGFAFRHPDLGGC